MASMQPLQLAGFTFRNPGAAIHPDMMRQALLYVKGALKPNKTMRLTLLNISNRLVSRSIMRELTPCM